ILLKVVMTMKSILFILLTSLSLGFAERKPNILWIFVEDLSPYFGCYGDEINAGHTEAIDALAAQGILYKRAFVPAPVCSACRSAMITGVHQTSIGAHQHRSSRYTNGEIVPEEVRIQLPEGMKTIPQLMKESGYYTFNQGKDDYNFHYDRRELYTVGTEPEYKVGMNGWQGNTAVDKKDFTLNTWASRPDKSQPWFGQLTLWGGKGDKKFCPKDELLPPKALTPPPYFPDTPAIRAMWTEHYNNVRGHSHLVQQVMDQLKADGELENTIIFYFSDHGNNKSIRHKQSPNDRHARMLRTGPNSVYAPLHGWENPVGPRSNAADASFRLVVAKRIFQPACFA
ncbi:MAG: sulfatase-like hydrolase/transferase, partial [Verrucomicrobiota bacterium]